MSDSRYDDGVPVDPNAQLLPMHPPSTEHDLLETPYSVPAQPSDVPRSDNPSYPQPAYAQPPWSGQSAPASRARSRRGLLIAVLAAVVLVAAGVASYVVFVSGGPGSTPQAAVKAWLDATNAGHLSTVRSLTCAQDRNFLVNADLHPGSYRIADVRRTDAKHAVVHVVLTEAHYPSSPDQSVPVANQNGWKVCFGLFGPVH
jgi:hypothetical protein